MLFAQRVFYSDNGLLKDISTQVNDFRNSLYTVPFVSGEDCIYIGTFLPFNHRYFDIETANNVTSEVLIEIWNGKEFVAAVDVIDQTRLGTVSFAQDGVIRWSCSRNQIWSRQSDSFDVPGLEGTNIPNFYWIRLSFTQSLLNSTSLKFIGQKFSKDQDLFSYRPDLNNAQLLEAFQSGKTSWEEQHFIAAEQIVRDLKKKNIVLTADQILDFELMTEPSVWKAAELIYSGLGQPYEDRRKAAEGKYTESIDLAHLNTDQDQDGNLSALERVSRTGFFKR